MCILEDLKGWIGDRTTAGITGAFGAPGQNDKDRTAMEFYDEKRLCVGNTYFKPRSLHKYKRGARGQDGVVVKSMIDLVLVRRDMLRYVEHVRQYEEWDDAYQVTMWYSVKPGQ